MVKVALFGYSGSGKTTLFRYLTGKEEELYDPFKPNTGIGIYKDSNIDRLTAIHKARKVVYPEFEIFDFKGFPSVQGFPSDYFDNFFEMDVIVCVVNNFNEDSNPDKDASSLVMELILYDTEKIQTLLAKKEQDVGGSQQQTDVLKKALQILESEHFLIEMPAQDRRLISGIQLLTTRPVFLYINGDKKRFNITVSCPHLIQKDHNAITFYRSIMEAMKLITFYTVKGDIVQGWLIPSNYTARQAAGKVHKDIERGFIKAAAISLKDFFEIGSWQAAKNTGALKFLGPNSLLSDGDIVEFYFH
ncbi:MAG: DUF933 domain-containing protein [Candidatus Omnitrophica bacterium]|nr:DUF933 domain-containing protein [Candidatus Omnitrophota bacterium]